MRIGIQTWGSHGDIRPFIALAAGLQDAGHEVSLYATCIDKTDYTETARRLNLAMTMIASPVFSESDDVIELLSRVVNEKNPVRQLRTIVVEGIVPAVDAMYQASVKLCSQHDLIIGHFMHYPLYAAVEQAGVPYASVSLTPATVPARSRPPMGVPNLGPLGNTVLWWLGRKLVNRGLLPIINEFRGKHGLAPCRDVLTQSCVSHDLNLIGASPAMFPRPPEWEARHQICGFFNMPNLHNEGEVSVDLEQFLDQGKAPVYFTLGSMLAPLEEVQLPVLRLFTEAAKLAGCRAIIQGSLYQQCGFHSTPEIFYTSYAPHNRVFPRCAAIVHHGGSGTNQSSSLAGKPSIVIPHISEQEGWGKLLQSLGVAPAFIHRRDLTGKALAQRLRKVLDSPAMAARAEQLGKAMRAEDGVARAVALIDQVFQSGSSA